MERESIPRTDERQEARNAPENGDLGRRTSYPRLQPGRPPAPLDPQERVQILANLRAEVWFEPADGDPWAFGLTENGRSRVSPAAAAARRQVMIPADIVLAIAERYDVTVRAALDRLERELCLLEALLRNALRGNREVSDLAAGIVADRLRLAEGQRVSSVAEVPTEADPGSLRLGTGVIIEQDGRNAVVRMDPKYFGEAPALSFHEPGEQIRFSTGGEQAFPVIAAGGTSRLDFSLCKIERADLPEAIDKLVAIAADVGLPVPIKHPCAHCGERIAVCVGAYEDSDVALACGECCGHGNEDGWCSPIAELPRVLERLSDQNRFNRARDELRARQDNRLARRVRELLEHQVEGFCKEATHSTEELRFLLGWLAHQDHQVTTKHMLAERAQVAAKLLSDGAEGDFRKRMVMPEGSAAPVDFRTLIAEAQGAMQKLTKEGRDSLTEREREILDAPKASVSPCHDNGASITDEMLWDLITVAGSDDDVQEWLQPQLRKWRPLVRHYVAQWASAIHAEGVSPPRTPAVLRLRPPGPGSAAMLQYGGRHFELVQLEGPGAERPGENREWFLYFEALSPGPDGAWVHEIGPYATFETALDSANLLMALRRRHGITPPVPEAIRSWPPVVYKHVRAYSESEPGSEIPEVLIRPPSPTWSTYIGQTYGLVQLLFSRNALRWVAYVEDGDKARELSGTHETLEDARDYAERSRGVK